MPSVHQLTSGNNVLAVTRDWFVSDFDKSLIADVVSEISCHDRIGSDYLSQTLLETLGKE